MIAPIYHRVSDYLEFINLSVRSNLGNFLIPKPVAEHFVVGLSFNDLGLSGTIPYILHARRNL